MPAGTDVFVAAQRLSNQLTQMDCRHGQSTNTPCPINPRMPRVRLEDCDTADDGHALAQEGSVMGQAKVLVDRVWQALEAQDYETFAGLFTADAEERQAGMTVRGREQIRAFVASFFTAFPDLRHEIVAWVEDGDTIAVELRVTGTHTGSLPTPNGAIAATGRRITLETCDYITVVGDKIMSWHVYMDQVAFMTQLGLMPQPQATGL
jgi:uncharacterized protein (TIGR02246 family)